ncbi:MAG: hypothetical protein KGJ40_03440 [candidate division NC10 bacterium]|nr:hypothetical protein [candidate division NC10 bacterium]
MKHFRDRPWLSNLALILALVITALVLPAVSPDAQEIIDPKSGQLFLSVTDLTVQAGPVSLEVRRSLETGKGSPGLLGARWRLNWESRLVQARPLVLIEEMTGAVSFTQDGARGEYKSAVGDRLVFDKTGRVTRTKPDGTKETFDAKGRLVERDYRNGNKAIVQYGSDGRLARIEGPHGSALRFTIDKTGRLTQIEASTTATVRYVYQSGELAEVQRSPALPTRYSYFTDGRLARIEDPQSGGVQFAYDFKGRVMSRRFADGSKERYEYDDPTNTIRQIDPAGGVTTIQWSQDKRRAEITNPFRHKSVIVSDTVGRPLQITGPTGASARLTYDALGRTVALQNPLGQVTRFEYLEATSRPRVILHPDGTRQVFEYDRRGNLTTIKLGTEALAQFTYHPDGSVASAKGFGTPERRLTYDPDGRLKSIANALGDATHFEYDRHGNLVREVNPLGGAIVSTYDAEDRLVSRTNPAGGTTRYEYDAKGRVSRLLDPSGAVTRFEYNARGRLVAETGPTGLVTKYEYDAAGREVKVIEPGNRITTRRYDALGNVTGLTDPLGRTTQFEYDQLGRLVRERRSAGLEIAYRYDGLGNLLGIEDNTGAKSELKRDASGLLISSVNPLGAATRYQHDPLGNLVALTDPAGHITRYAYSQVGALAGVKLPSGDEARYQYDTAGRLVGLRRPSGGMTRITYGAMDNTTAVTDSLGNKRQQTYDLSGRLIGATDAAGRTTGYVYDRSGRLAEKRLPDGTKVTYEYDALGNRLKADDGAFPVLHGYDQNGRLVRVEYPAIKKSVRYAYDPSGLKTKLIDSEGRGISYEYNALKQLSAIVLPDGKRITLAYDLKDRLSSVQYPNGVSGQWEYDAAGRIVKISYRDRDRKAMADFAYKYDPAGNPVERQDSQDRTTRLQYDSAGQLLEEVSPAGTTRYRYLPGGNRATVEEQGAVTQYRYDADDRLIQAGTEQITYDKNGNLIGRKVGKGTTVYEYNAEDQLVKASAPDGAITSFGYAPTGERAWKRDHAGLSYFVYDGFHLIQELNEGGSVKTTYVHGPGIDRPLAMIQDGKTYYYHADRLGSITHLTDEQGQVVATYDYDPFGKMRKQHGSIHNPFTFTGREWDASTGLYYYRARYYDAGLGRFLSPDPVSVRFRDPLTLNPYLYARNNPVRLVDPLGLDEFDPMGLNVYDPAAFHNLTDEELSALENYYHNRAIRLEDLQSRIYQRVPWDAPDAEGELWPRRPFTPTESARLNRWEGAGAQAEENAELVRRIQEYRSGAAPAPRVSRGPVQPSRGPNGTIIENEGLPPTRGNTLIERGGSGNVTPGDVVGWLVGGITLVATVTDIVTSDHPAQAAGEVVASLSGQELGAAFGGALLGPPGAIIGGFIGGMIATCMVSPCAGGGPIPYLPQEQAHATDPASTVSTPASPVTGGTSPTTYVPLPPTVPPPAGTLIGPPGLHPIPLDSHSSPLPPADVRSVDPSAPASGATLPPTAPTLISFVVSCSPSQIKVGQSSSCKAFGEYSTQPGRQEDLTDLAAWGPGPTIIGDWPGSWLASASYGGKRADATVTVMAGDQGPGPDITGAGQQPFSGGIPQAPGTSGATGGGQPVDQPGLKPPPPGPGDAGTTPSQQPPQQGVICYSDKTQESYWLPYGPCPPPWMKPPAGSTAGGQPGRIPWQGLIPGGQPPAGGGGGGGSCPTGQHTDPATGRCHSE